MTNEQLQAENERLGAEVAALRVLLTAVRQAADVPMPASNSDLQLHFMVCVRRADVIAIYASADGSAGVLHDRAERLREEAARPLRYATNAKDAEVPA